MSWLKNKNLIMIILGPLISPMTLAQTINPANSRYDLQTYRPNSLSPLLPFELGRPTLNAGYPTLSSVISPILFSADETLGETWFSMDFFAQEAGPLFAMEQEIQGIKSWRIRPIASTGVFYDDNIYISQRERQADTIFTVNAGLALELGDYRDLKENCLLVEYDATGFFYVNHPQSNACDQNAYLMGQYCFGKTIMQLNSTYQYLTGPDRDAGNFARYHFINNDFRFYYDYSDKTRMVIEIRQTAYIYQTYLNSCECLEKLGVDYFIAPKLSIGVEGRLGQLAIQQSPFQVYEEAGLRFHYEVSQKIAIQGSGGVDIRQYTSGGKNTWVTPVYSFGVEYKPFTNIFFILENYRLINPAAANVRQDFIATGVVLNIKQILYQKFSFGIGVGYENDQYVANTKNIDAQRRDNFVFVRPNLAFAITWWLSIGIFYEFQKNFSTMNQNSFYDNRVGFRVYSQF